MTNQGFTQWCYHRNSLIKKCAFKENRTRLFLLEWICVGLFHLSHFYVGNQIACTLCPRSIVQFYIVSLLWKLDKISWTISMFQSEAKHLAFYRHWKIYRTENTKCSDVIISFDQLPVLSESEVNTYSLNCTSKENMCSLLRSRCRQFKRGSSKHVSGSHDFPAPGNVTSLVRGGGRSGPVLTVVKVRFVWRDWRPVRQARRERGYRPPSTTKAKTKQK